ncbi:MAG TPA: hypothetical protein VGB07_13295 [Blastocatellia bacterium]
MNNYTRKRLVILMVGDAEIDRIAVEAGGVEFIHASEFWGWPPS